VPFFAQASRRLHIAQAAAAGLEAQARAHPWVTRMPASSHASD